MRHFEIRNIVKFNQGRPLFILAFLMLTLMVGVKSHAQDSAQTPGNAKKFLEISLPGSKINKNDSPRIDTLGLGGKWIGSIKSAIPTTDSCIVRMGYFRSGFRHYWKKNYFTRYKDETYPVLLNFRKIQTVNNASGSREIVISTTGEQHSQAIYVINSEIASRIAFAMQFLVQKCNYTNSLGF